MSKNIILSALVIISLFFSCSEQPVSNIGENPDGLRSVSLNSVSIFSGPISEMPYYENYIRDCNRYADTVKKMVAPAKAEAKITFTEAKVFVVNQTSIYKQEMALGYENFECKKNTNNSELFYNKTLNKWSMLFPAINNYIGADVIYSGSLNVDGDYVTGQIWIKPGFNLVYVFYLQNDDIVRYSYATYAEWPDDMEGHYHHMESGWEKSYGDSIWSDQRFESQIDTTYSDQPIYYLERLDFLGVSPQYAASKCGTYFKPVKSIAAGLQHTLIVYLDGSLIGFGDNYYGQLGLNSSMNNMNTKQTVFASGIIDVAAGHDHTLILQNDGLLLSCGRNQYGQLGDGTTIDKNIPVVITGNVKAISASIQHSLFLKNDGTLWGCGSNLYGQVGDSSLTQRNFPVQINGIPDSIVTIETGGWHSLAVTATGKLYGWGINGAGQLGNLSFSNSPFPILLPIDSVAAVSAGQAYTLVLKKDGTLWGCGENNQGQLAYSPAGAGEKRNYFFQIISGVVSMSAGGWSSVAIKNDGQILTWGFGQWGQLGNGTNTHQQTIPVSVADLNGLGGSVFAGGYHIAFVGRNQSIWLWGLAQFGELGDGQGNRMGTENRNLPWLLK